MESSQPRAALCCEAAPPGRLVVLRALQLGDLLCAVPALRALRRAAPAAHIALVGLPWARDFVRRFGAYLDEFIEFPGYPGLPERPVDVRAVPRFLAEVQARAFDLSIQMHGDGRVSNGLVALFGARRQAGFGDARAAPAAPGAAVLPYPSSLPEVQRLLLLVEWLGGAGQGEQLEFPLDAAEEAAWGRLRLVEGLTGDYVCVHAGARDAARRWPVASFAEVSRVLAGRGLRVVLTGDGDDDRERARAIARACPAPIIDLAGRTSLGVVAAAVRDARLVVCNDTGISHLAAAVRTPSVVVFLASDPERWAPLDRGRHRVVRDGSEAVRAAIAEAERLLAGEGVRAA